MIQKGAFDPWGAGGVNYTMSDSITSVWIPNGAHHIDLMFSHPDDTADIKAARVLELAQIRKWIAAYGEDQARATSRRHEEH
jgi:lysosomal Pro-X carboxypeptidase